MLRTPGGRPASSKISPHSSPPTMGESSDGLRTTVLPSASGAAIERADRISAAFQGAIAATTPTGCRRPMANAPGMSEGSTSPIGAYASAGGLAEEPRHEAHLEHAEAEARARLARKQRDDLVLPPLEDVGRAQEDPLAHRRRRLRPLGEGRRGGCDRAPRVLATSCRHARDDVAGERIDDRRTSRRRRPRPSRR